VLKRLLFFIVFLLAALPAWAQFTFIASASNLNNAAGTTLDTSTSLNVAAGDLLVAWIANEDSASTYAVAKDSGSPANTFTFDAADAETFGGSLWGQWGYLLSASADSTATLRATWGTSVAVRRFLVMQFRPSGGATVTKDVGAAGNGGTGTAAVSDAITTTGTDEVVCGASDLFNSGATTAEQIGGVNAAGVVRRDAASMWYRILTATMSTGTATSTQAASDQWIASIISFKATGGGAAPVRKLLTLGVGQ
jgi:hypothetical protein